MFTFEDILKTDGIGVQNKGLFLPLKTVMDELKETLFSNVSERVAVMLKEDLESLGPMKTSEVEKAQQNIIYMSKQFEENGKTAITSRGERLAGTPKKFNVHQESGQLPTRFFLPVRCGGFKKNDILCKKTVFP